jgi:hypothetical protein
MAACRAGKSKMLTFDIGQRFFAGIYGKIQYLKE